MREALRMVRRQRRGQRDEAQRVASALWSNVPINGGKAQHVEAHV